jgi:S-sulfo-L-cysteine synthase (O-acetyl-L-serine-dependent)
MKKPYLTIEDTIGNTPLVQLQRLPAHLGTAKGNVILGKLEGNNPAGSVKDRPALAMIARAEQRGDIKPGDTLIEATSGNTGIALAMAAAIKGYRMVLIMPDNLSIERRQSMKAYGADLILVEKKDGMEGARDLADAMQARGEGKVLDQFANDDRARNLGRYRRPRYALCLCDGNDRNHYRRFALPQATACGYSNCRSSTQRRFLHPRHS